MMVNALGSACGFLSAGSSIPQRVRDAFRNDLFVSEADASPEAQAVLRQYRESVAAADDEQMATLRTFRAPGRVIFLRPHLKRARQPYAPLTLHVWYFVYLYHQIQ